MATKAELRARINAARAERSPAERERADADLCARILDLPDIETATLVAAYVNIRDEPPTTRMLSVLREKGVPLLLPMLSADGDLDWASYDGPDALVDGRHGLREPGGPPLGREAIGAAAVVLVPALAVDGHGHRLGRGGGGYDRALRRAIGLTVAVVYDDELVEEVPVEDHDVSVDAVVTPTQLRRLH